MASILNIALQNCSITRPEHPDEATEGKFNVCSCAASIRESAEGDPALREAWASCIKPLQEIVEKRFERCAVKEKTVKPISPIPGEEIQSLNENLSHIFPGIKADHLLRMKDMQKNEAYSSWAERHSKEQKYTFQIKNVMIQLVAAQLYLILISCLGCSTKY